MKKTSCCILLIMFFIVSLLGGCGPKSIPPGPSKRPPSSAVPGTQRPYRINGKTYYPLPSADGFTQTGIASWYGAKFHGRKTANGETYNMYGKTAAHKTLPMNTYLLVKNLRNGRETVVRVNDRGPFVRGRIIDLTKSGAQALGIIKSGTARVRIVALGEAVNYGTGKKKIKRFLPHQNFQRGDFYVQIGSFSQRANAVTLSNKMSAWGRQAVIRTFDRGDRIFYRVQVRAGATLTEARHLEKSLEAAGLPGFVVAR
ncbi:MAG: septal ring lytic transglycosylase RlpA family protein [Desulfobacterales bacterium]|nr:septal ring lytic transglycosylase RlpA family protein [Desulfobacterales bacterium]